MQSSISQIIPTTTSLLSRYLHINQLDWTAAFCLLFVSVVVVFVSQFCMKQQFVVYPWYPLCDQDKMALRAAGRNKHSSSGMSSYVGKMLRSDLFCSYHFTYLRSLVSKTVKEKGFWSKNTPLHVCINEWCVK